MTLRYWAAYSAYASSALAVAQLVNSAVPSPYMVRSLPAGPPTPTQAEQDDRTNCSTFLKLRRTAEETLALGILSSRLLQHSTSSPPCSPASPAVHQLSDSSTPCSYSSCHHSTPSSSASSDIPSYDLRQRAR